MCCEIINRCIPLMDGLNDAAREFLLTKNTPASLIADLQATFALVCFDGQTALGLGALHRANCEIKRVYVDPLQHHHGVGRSIMQRLEEEAAASGTKTISVQASLNAVSFYERLGYQHIRPETITISDSVFEVIYMTKPLIE